MKQMYLKRKDIMKLFVVSFLVMSFTVAVGNEVKHSLLLMMTVVVVGLMLTIYSANFYLQQLVFYSEKITIVYQLQNKSFDIKYEQIDKAVITHVNGEGLQLIFYLNSEVNKKRNIQWDFSKKKDQLILQILREHGVRVVLE